MTNDQIEQGTCPPRRLWESSRVPLRSGEQVAGKLGCDRRRRRPQRSDLRGLPGAGGQAGARARSPRARRRRVHARSRSGRAIASRRAPTWSGCSIPLVIDELEMADYGFRWLPAEPGCSCRSRMARSIQLWDDDDLCEEEIRRLAPADLKGWRAFCDVKRRLRDALRPDGRRRPLDRPGAVPRRARAPAGRRPRSSQAALRMVDGRVRRALHRRRAAPIGLSRPGGHRHLRQPARPGDGVDPLPPPVGPAGGDARHVGLRRGRNGHGLVHPLRHRARPRRRRLDGRSGGPDHPGRRRRARRGRADRVARASSRTPTRG